MKKFFAFVAVALVAFGFASCNGNNPSANAYKITVSNITAKSATITVVPADTTTTYYWDIMASSEAAKMTDEQVGAYLKEYLEEAVEYYKQYGVDATIADFLIKGEDSYDYTKLESNTEYTVVAVALDETGASHGAVARQNFKTLEEKEDPVPADMTFEIAVSDITFNSAYVSVVPSSNEHTYFWNIFESEVIADMNDADLCAAVKANIENTIEYYGYFGYDYTFEDFLSKGSDAYDFNDLEPQKAYTVIAVAMGSLGTTNGAVAKYNFETAELVAESTVDITIENAKMTDACDAYGWWQMQAINADSTFYLTVSPEEAATVEGSYTIDDMDADYTYVLLDKEDQYKFATLDVEVAVDGENFTLTGTGLALNAVEYHFNISGSVVVGQASDAPAKVAPAKKDAKLIKKVNLEKKAFRSEKLFNL